MKMLKLKMICLILFLSINSIYAQQTPAPKQSETILITGATAHLGNGKVIENSAIGFQDGKFTFVDELSKANPNDFQKVIDAKGHHVYPGFISPNSTLGLVEIDAVSASDDEREVGAINPHIRSIIAYNTESRVTETVRPNGVLIAQVTPRGGLISGTSSIVQLDAWNYEDAIITENDGIHVNWGKSYANKKNKIEPSSAYKKNKKKLKDFFTKAKDYKKNSKERNLVYEAVQPILEGKAKLFIHVHGAEEMTEAIDFFENFGVKDMVIVGGYEAYKVAPLLKEKNIPVLLYRVHSLPMSEDDAIDLPFELPKKLLDAGVLVGFENSGDMERMQTRNLPFYAGTAINYGVPYEEALKMLTSNTAKILGIEKEVGSIEVGKNATLFISKGDALDIIGNDIYKAFIDGRDISLESHHTQLYKKFQKKLGQE